MVASVLIKWKLIGKNKLGLVLAKWCVRARSALFHMIDITFNVKLNRPIVANSLARRMHIRTFASARAARATLYVQCTNVSEGVYYEIICVLASITMVNIFLLLRIPR